MTSMKKQERGGTIVGFILGLIVGLGSALAVAVYVTKVPVPFLNKGGTRSASQDADEAQRNRNWDPNAPLYGKTPVKPIAPASAPVSAPPPATAAASPQPAASTPAANADPLGALATARAASSDPFDYYVQAGAFRNQAEAEAQRAKLAMLGWESRVSEREQNGRPVFRVRVGPFTKRDDAEQFKDKLVQASIDSTLVRVAR
jgi:cell division protein FtsN